MQLNIFKFEEIRGNGKIISQYTVCNTVLTCTVADFQMIISLKI